MNVFRLYVEILTSYNFFETPHPNVQMAKCLQMYVYMQEVWLNKGGHRWCWWGYFSFGLH